MKPVNKPAGRGRYSPFTSAKPELLQALGKHCSYCERSGEPQDLHVEHIYPAKAHPAQSTSWDNFLLSCNTCNTYKRLHLGDGRQRSLHTRYLWPHLDNTANAFVYRATGEVAISSKIPAGVRRAAELTRDMAGLLLNPARAASYRSLGIAYDGASKRTQIWNQASLFRKMFLEDPTIARAAVIADGASLIGYFSVWMAVFHDQPIVRIELIRAFSADSSCFDPSTSAPVPKGRL